jgi:hypothetical protein
VMHILCMYQMVSQQNHTPGSCGKKHILVKIKNIYVSIAYLRK